MGRTLEDIRGKKYGMLTVLKFSHMIKNNSYWVCKCDCGNVVTVRRGAFVYQGRPYQNISCGCLKKQMDKQLSEYIKKSKIEAEKMLERRNKDEK